MAKKTHKKITSIPSLHEIKEKSKKYPQEVNTHQEGTLKKPAIRRNSKKGDIT
jgi:hypothetical protein